jgi:hypothetical protein
MISTKQWPLKAQHHDDLIKSTHCLVVSSLSLKPPKYVLVGSQLRCEHLLSTQSPPFEKRLRLWCRGGQAPLLRNKATCWLLRNRRSQLQHTKPLPSGRMRHDRVPEWTCVPKTKVAKHRGLDHLIGLFRTRPMTSAKYTHMCVVVT